MFVLGTRPEARGDVDIVATLHPHLQSGAVLARRLRGVAGVTLSPPLDYPVFVALLRRTRAVLTDSGGVQEEAPAVGCPLLVLRDMTERMEGVAAGSAQLVGTDPATIVAAANRLLDDGRHHAAMARHAAVRRRSRGTAHRRAAAGDAYRGTSFGRAVSPLGGHRSPSWLR